jgi:hypothetical protein
MSERIGVPAETPKGTPGAQELLSRRQVLVWAAGAVALLGLAGCGGGAGGGSKDRGNGGKERKQDHNGNGGAGGY